MLALLQTPGQPGPLQRGLQGLAGQIWPSVGLSTGRQSQPAGSSPARSSLLMPAQPTQIAAATASAVADGRFTEHPSVCKACCESTSEAPTSHT